MTDPPGGSDHGRVRCSPQYGLVSAAECLSGSGLDLLRCQIAEVLGDVPTMPKRIGQLPMALAPELIGQLVVDLSTRIKCPLPQRARIVGLDLQHSCGAA